MDEGPGQLQSLAVVAMRAGCRHLQSHTYSSGRVVERCDLHWAPAAPCDCPDLCERFAPRRDEAVPESESVVLDLRDAFILDVRRPRTLTQA